jgi:hypothetical protein
VSEPWAPTPQWDNTSGQQFPPSGGLPATPPPAAPVKRWWLLAAGALVLALVAGGIGYVLGHGAAIRSAAASASQAASASAATADARLQKAYDNCLSADGDTHTLQLDDAGNTIVIDTRSQYTSTAGMDCVLQALGTPQSVIAEIGATTAMMGSRNASQDGLDYNWSYHPDNGVNMVITYSK